MNKKLSYFLLLSSLISLGGCNSSNSSIDLTYGRIVEAAKDGIVSLDYQGLSRRLSKEGELKEENFLLLTLPQGCSCRDTSINTINKIIYDHHILVYSIELTEIGNKEAFGIVTNTSDTSLYLFSKGNMKKKWTYSASNSMLKEADYTFKEIQRYVNVDNMHFYSTTKEYLDNQLIGQNQTFSIEYIWDFCGDCLYVNPNMLWKYNSWKNNNKIYVVDIGDLTFVDGVFDKTNPNYVNYLSEHNLSETSNPTFGYDSGKVPTIQHYTNGVLDDSIVIFNDISETTIEGNQRITKSFFDEERKNKVHYLDNVIYQSLVGLEFANTNHELLAPYYEPYLNAYLSYYH